MTTQPSVLDLATINAAESVVLAALRNQVCQWEQESADAIAEGHLSLALMKQNWSFAANLLVSTTGTEFHHLLMDALDARMNPVLPAGKEDLGTPSPEETAAFCASALEVLSV